MFICGHLIDSLVFNDCWLVCGHSPQVKNHLLCFRHIENKMVCVTPLNEGVEFRVELQRLTDHLKMNLQPFGQSTNRFSHFSNKKGKRIAGLSS